MSYWESWLQSTSENLLCTFCLCTRLPTWVHTSSAYGVSIHLHVSFTATSWNTSSAHNFMMGNMYSLFLNICLAILRTNSAVKIQTTPHTKRSSQHTMKKRAFRVRLNPTQKWWMKFKISGKENKIISYPNGTTWNFWHIPPAQWYTPSKSYLRYICHAIRRSYTKFHGITVWTTGWKPHREQLQSAMLCVFCAMLDGFDALSPYHFFFARSQHIAICIDGLTCLSARIIYNIRCMREMRTGRWRARKKAANNIDVQSASLEAHQIKCNAYTVMYILRTYHTIFAKIKWIATEIRARHANMLLLS